MSLTKVTYTMIEGRTVTPEDFGAVGDGVTDDTLAIQAAINSFTILNQINGGIILAQNNYAISDTLLFYNSSIDFSGSGFGAVTGLARTFFKWIGPAGKPMIRIQSSRATKIRNLRLIGDKDNKPSAGINMFVLNDGITFPTDISQNSYTQVENVWIGAYDGNDPTPSQAGRQFANGILFSGSNTGNNYNNFSNIRIGACDKGVHIPTNQFGLNFFDGLWVTGGDYGFYIKCPGAGMCWFFDNNQIADIYVGEAGHLELSEFYSEASASFADIMNGRLTVNGGGFACNANTFGGVVVNATGGNPSVLCLNDFSLTNNYVLGTPMFNFHSGNANSVKSFTGRRVYGITAAMIDMETTIGTPDQLNLIDLEILGSFNGDGFGPGQTLFQNTLVSSAGLFTENIDSNRKDITANVSFKKATYRGGGNLADTATPSVANADLWNTGGTTAITAFTNGTSGQIIIILAYHNITITNNAELQLAGAVNFNMKNLDTLTLVQISSNLWRELGRSVN